MTDENEKIALLQKYVDEAKRIVFFGGTGVSTESGIPDFRSVDGLYNQKYAYPPETILSHSFFLRRTEEFFRFYRDKMVFPDKQPNKAHLKLAELEQAGKLSAVVTQNIDGLHQKAGSRHVCELHGSVWRNRCMKCGRAFPTDIVLNTDGVPHCPCGGIIKPDVVLYEEALDGQVIEDAVQSIASADLLIVGGTSLNVYPAASFIDLYRGKHLVLINRSETPKDGMADLILRGNIGEVLDKIHI